MKAVKDYDNFNQDIVNQIIGAQDSTAGARMDTMRNIYALQHGKAMAYNYWLRLALDDSSSLDLSDIVDTLLLEEDNLSLSRLSELYLLLDSTSKASSTLDSMQLDNEEWSAYYDFQKLHIELLENDKQFIEADSADRITLWDIAATNTRAGILAQNVLRMVMDTTFDELVEELDTTGSSKMGSYQAAESFGEDSLAVEGLNITIFPNPAADAITVSYSLEEEQHSADFNIYNLMGETLMNAKLNNQVGTVTYDIGHIPEGVYLFEVVVQDERVEQGKLIIVR